VTVEAEVVIRWYRTSSCNLLDSTVVRFAVELEFNGELAGHDAGRVKISARFADSRSLPDDTLHLMLSHS
jgi:hypothetical protein